MNVIDISSKQLVIDFHLHDTIFASFFSIFQDSSGLYIKLIN